MANIAMSISGDSKTQLIQKIKNGQEPVRILSARIYLPIKGSKIKSGRTSYQLVITEKKSNDNKNVVNGTITTYGDFHIGDNSSSSENVIYSNRDESTVRIMNRLLDNLFEAISLEDYDALKNAQNEMDRFEEEASSLTFSSLKYSLKKS